MNFSVIPINLSSRAKKIGVIGQNALRHDRHDPPINSHSYGRMNWNPDSIGPCYEQLPMTVEI